MKNQRFSRERMREIKMFELKKETVEIIEDNGNKSVYEISPLMGENLSDLYSVIAGFDKVEKSSDKDNESSFLELLGTDTSTKLHKLVYMSLKQSYPQQKDSELNQFAAQNMMKFIEAIIKVNLPKEWDSVKIS